MANVKGVAGDNSSDKVSFKDMVGNNKDGGGDVSNAYLNDVSQLDPDVVEAQKDFWKKEEELQKTQLEIKNNLNQLEKLNK